MVPVLLLPCPGMRALEEANPTKHCRQSTVCWGSTPCAHSGRVPSQVQMLTSSPREHSSLWCSLSSVWTIVLRMEGYPCLASLVLRRFGCYHLVSSSYPEFTGNIQINETLSVSISSSSFDTNTCALLAISVYSEFPQGLRFYVPESSCSTNTLSRCLHSTEPLS